MKQALMILAICVVSLTVQAQCWDVVEDEFTGKKTSMFSEILSVDEMSGALIYMYDTQILKNIIYFKFLGPDCNVRCTDEHSYVDIVFDDGSKQMIRNRSEFDCDGKVSSKVKPIIDRLSSTAIVKIRLTGYDYETYALDVPQNDANRVQVFFKCLLENS